MLIIATIPPLMKSRVIIYPIWEIYENFKARDSKVAGLFIYLSPETPSASLRHSPSILTSMGMFHPARFSPPVSDACVRNFSGDTHPNHHNY